jgi:thioredoxin-like negative regulator of GroEL
LPQDKQSQAKGATMIEVVDSTFKETVTQVPNAVVYFWASWCKPCVTLSPIVEKMSQKYDNALFIKANVDANMLSAYDAGVKVVPTIVLYNNARPYEILIPPFTEEYLDAVLVQYLAPSL